MSFMKRIGTKSAIATLGLGLMAAAPITVFANGNDHVNDHINAHINANGDDKNGHLNTHLNEHLNVHVNEHGNDQSNRHLNAHTNAHVNDHTNEHVNVHTNAHTNVHENTHINIHTQGNGVTDESIHLNIHGTGAAAELESALQSLHCDQVDYLYAYLQAKPCSENEIEQIHVNVKAMEHLCAHPKGNGHLSTGEMHEAWRLFIKTMNLAHVQVACVDRDEHPIDLFTYTGQGTLNLQLKDKADKVLATIQTPSQQVTPTVFVRDVTSADHAAVAARTLAKGGRFVPAPAGVLPKTATNEPLMLLLGALLILFGGVTFGLAYRWTKGAKKQ